MACTYLKARAKINVGLDVIARRPDGYHEMRMVMQTVALSDLIYVKAIDKKTLKLICNIKWLPVDERNLVYRAAQYMMDEYKLDKGIFIELTKSIPISAGLAGGSADCAATLVGIRNIFKLPIRDAELMEIGKKFGADVPYCIMRGTALAEGIGEKLKRLPAHPHTYVLLAKPSVNISTAAVFKELDLSTVTEHPDIDKIISHISAGDLDAIAKSMSNVLESVTIRNHPIIAEIKRVMVDKGALGAVMSGSGPTVFGYFKEKDKMQAAADVLKKDLEIREIFFSYIYNP